MMRTGTFFLAAGLCFAAPSDRALVDAAKANNSTLAMSILEMSGNANSAEADGTSALHWAVRYDDIDLAKMLLAAGANVKAENRYGVTPLQLAAENGNAEVMKALLAAGADPNGTANLNETVLMIAARTGRVDAAKVLLDAGAKVDAREQWHGETALMYATVEHNADMMKLLIEHGADVNAKSDVKEWERQVTSEPRDKWLPLGGMTPLLFAAREGCVACATVLADAGADLNVQDPHGVGTLVIAIINGQFDVAGYLVDRGTNPNLADDTGRTALFAAADWNTIPMSNRPAPPVIIHQQLTALELMAKLLDKGADINAQLTKQQPYRAKLDRGDDTMLSAGTTALLRAAKAGDIPAVKLLIARGADINLPTRAGITPMAAAAGLGTKEEDTTGRYKTEEEAIETVQLLLDKGADINAANGQGQTALHAAAKMGLNKVVEYLVQKGAAINAKDSRGFTPLDNALGLAGGSGGFDGSRRDVHESTAELLKKLGATTTPSKASPLN